MPLYMVFDVESIGLHGEGFAVGFVVVDETGKRIDQGLIACPREWATGNYFDHDWVKSNVTTDVPNEITICELCGSPKDVRVLFWEKWKRWEREGATLWSDCAWPVESRFLIACVEDDMENRRFGGPYPLFEIASLLMAIGLDPTDSFKRKDDEQPAHNPLMDARQSARLLIACLQSISAKAATQ